MESLDQEATSNDSSQVSKVIYYIVSDISANDLSASVGKGHNQGLASGVDPDTNVQVSNNLGYVIYPEVDIYSANVICVTLQLIQFASFDGKRKHYCSFYRIDYSGVEGYQGDYEDNDYEDNVASIENC
ncbi:MAG: hypothetical protein EZS28_007652 [Streblomastix strix]|uniref:Uncharacterized protein n=1 Tax=Streblomastix strix TaxID=222440 RepID=A0A5J4WQK9_9EUKA|nr:MAG: hypothetical protein EZS28_007652 [Streblomastix strix]